MARYMLDKNFCIYLIRNQPARLAKGFTACFVGDVVISAMTCAELEFGVLPRANGRTSGARWPRCLETFPCSLATLAQHVLTAPCVWPRVNATGMRSTR